MAKNFFTVVIPTLNEESRLPHLLEDLKKQTFRNFSIIVVDAKSEDKTQSVAKKYKVLLLTSPKRNVSYQRNLGAKKTKTGWIVFMDADNRITKTYLAKVYKHIIEHDSEILSTWMNPSTKSKKDKLTATILNQFMDLYKNTKKPYVMESMLFVKKDCFEKIGGFNPEIPWREGEELLEKAKRLGLNFEFIKYPKYTYSFRRLKKVGAFKMIQQMSQMEIIKVLKGDLTEKETQFLYPMKGGSFYSKGTKKKLTLKKIISILFE